MSATRGLLVTDKASTASRLSNKWIEAHADTYRTFASVTTWADGHGEVIIRRDGALLHRWEWPAEEGEK